MLITSRQNTPYGQYDSFSTHLLIGESNTGSKDISIQVTDVDPDGMQFLHSHEQAQCYYIISGSGVMTIDDDLEEVQEGDAVFIPPNAIHGIKNAGEGRLTYLTANRAFGTVREKEIWPDETAGL